MPANSLSGNVAVAQLETRTGSTVGVSLIVGDAAGTKTFGAEVTVGAGVSVGVTATDVLIGYDGIGVGIFFTPKPEISVAADISIAAIKSKKFMISPFRSFW